MWGLYDKEMFQSKISNMGFKTTEYLATIWLSWCGGQMIDSYQVVIVGGIVKSDKFDSISFTHLITFLVGVSEVQVGLSILISLTLSPLPI